MGELVAQKVSLVGVRGDELQINIFMFGKYFNKLLTGKTAGAQNTSFNYFTIFHGHRVLPWGDSGVHLHRLFRDEPALDVLPGKP